MENNGKDKKTT